VRWSLFAFGTTMLLVSSGATAAALASAEDVQGMKDANVLQVILATLEYHSGINLLILAAYGFAAGRAWREGDTRPTWRQVWHLVPGLVFVCLAILVTGWEYFSLGEATSTNALVKHAAGWGVSMIVILLFQALSVVSIFFVVKRG
jgi:hypothetical protein